MTIALLGITSIYNGFQKFLGSTMNFDTAFEKNAPSHTVSISAATAGHGFVPRQAQHRALRVLRVSEQGDATSCAGRMVISGRMADVCAELDRLVALEAKSKHSLPH
jgi:phosphoketolase